MVSQGSILIVSHQAQARLSIRAALAARGYLVSDTDNGSEVLDLLRRPGKDLAIMEAELPGKTGVDLTLAIRGTGSQIGIIILSDRNRDEDKILALEAGADDYIVRPFSVPELVARVAALLRRKASPLSSIPLRSLKLGDRHVDFRSRRIVAKGAEIPLTSKEFEVLLYLASHGNRTISGSELVQRLWPFDSRDRKGSLRVVINRLRNKIEPFPGHPQYLITEPWFGYRIRIPE